MTKVLFAAILGVLVLMMVAGCYPAHQVAVGTPPAPPSETAAASSVSVPVSSGTTSHTYGGAGGWYMISAPSESWASAYGSTAWRWTGARYEEHQYLEPGRGYWVRLSPNHQVQVTKPPQDIFEPLGQGWSMISVSFPTPKSHLRFEAEGMVKSYPEAVAAGWIRPTIWGYRADQGNRYHGVDMLDPWYGYFLFVTRNLVFLGGGQQKTPGPGPTPGGPLPVGRIDWLSAKMLISDGLEAGVPNTHNLEFYDFYAESALSEWVNQYRLENPPPAWPDMSSTYEESFVAWVRRQAPHAAVGMAILQPPQAAVGRGYPSGQARPWVSTIVPGPQGPERRLIDIRRALGFRWDEILNGVRVDYM